MCCFKSMQAAQSVWKEKKSQGVVWIHRECDRKGRGGRIPPWRKIKAWSMWFKRMMVAIEEIQGLDASWRCSGEMLRTKTAVKINKQNCNCNTFFSLSGIKMITLPNHTVLKSGNTWCHIVNSHRLIQQPLRGWRRHCIMCWLAGRDDLIILVFMDHWAAGLDFCYWIMGNSSFLLKEWPSKSNKRVSSPWSGRLHHSEAAAAMSFSFHICGSDTWKQEGGGVCGAYFKPFLS